MLIQSVHYTFSLEDADRAAGILSELRDLSSLEPGVVSFLVARGKEKPNVFVLWEAYRDEAALNAHVETDHFKRLVINGTRRLAKAKERVGEIALPLA
jgi:autoinducer 2-degrading protein